MRTAITVLFFLPLLCATGQNISTKKMPGLAQYVHAFIKEHKLGEIGDDKYPHVHLYCRSNDSSMMVFRLIFEIKGSTPYGDDKTTPIINYDGDIFKSTSTKYEIFPLKDGVLETFEFYAPSIIMESLANSDDVKIDIGGAAWTYPAEMRKDYKELIDVVNSRNKPALITPVKEK